MKRGMIGYLLAVALLLGSGIAGAVTPVLSNTYSAGTLGATPYLNAPSISGSGVVFQDTYNFTVSPGATFVSESLSNIALPGFWNNSSLGMQLFDSANTALTGSVMSFYGPLSAGSYYAKVSGTTSGPYGGAYAFSAAAVPEAETWAMMLVGVGLVGFQLRRRGGRHGRKLS